MFDSCRHTSLLALAALLVSGPACATLIAFTDMKLDDSERLLVVGQVCSQRHKEAQVEARRVETDPITFWARVTCAPYGDLAGYPALKTAECEKRDGKWECKSASHALRIKVRAEHLVVEYSAYVTPEAAVEIVAFASGETIFNNLDVSGLVSGRCRVSDGSTVPFPGARNYNISCAAQSASITKDCWEGRCRLFFTDVDYSIP